MTEPDLFAQMDEMIRSANKRTLGSSLVDWIFTGGIHFDMKHRRAYIGHPDGQEIGWDEAVEITPFFIEYRKQAR